MLIYPNSRTFMKSLFIVIKDMASVILPWTEIFRIAIYYNQGFLVSKTERVLNEMFPTELVQCQYEGLEWAIPAHGIAAMLTPAIYHSQWVCTIPTNP